ncbi:MAG TPA: 50S ribosomal protein L18 [Bacteroidota bacterium]|jgi:large subunit ribosomal protein L18|nr:50S ribosomal protein L18 [Bacteroidota bacterium]
MIRKTKKTGRFKRANRIRKKISGTEARPRLTVYRSNTNIYAQIIDDTKGQTLVAVSSISKDIKESIKELKGKIEVSKVIGTALAKKALEKNITTVVFDRNGYKYHGRVKAVADAAREAGLKF